MNNSMDEACELVYPAGLADCLKRMIDLYVMF